VDQGSGHNNQQVFSKGEIRPQFFFAQTPQIFSLTAFSNSAHELGTHTIFKNLGSNLKYTLTLQGAADKAAIQLVKVPS